MVDTGARESMIIYDRVEYALNWMDRVITGEEFRNVLTKSKIIYKYTLNYVVELKTRYCTLMCVNL